MKSLPFDSNTVVFYHDDCMDGLYAAWCLWRVYDAAGATQPTFIPYDYHRTFVELELVNRAIDGQVASNIVLLDCSLNHEEARQILALPGCKRLVIIDHHKSAYEALLSPHVGWTGYEAAPLICFDTAYKTPGLLEHRWLSLDAAQPDAKRFDYYHCNEMSGAEMTFHLLCAEHEPYIQGCTPWWISYLADRDLWRHKLIHSEAVNRGLWQMATACSHDFEAMATFSKAWGPDKVSDPIGSFDTAYSPTIHASGGLHFLNHMREHGENTRVGLSMIVNDCARRSHRFTFEGQPALAACSPRALRSEVGAKLAQDAAVALVWDAHPDGTVNVSLRSTNGSGPDVSMLAVKHGGGGHKHASGFVCSMTTLHQIIYGS